MAKFNNFMFSVPSLPKLVYSDLKTMAARFGLDHYQMVILGVMAIKTLSKLDRGSLEELVKQLGGMYKLPDDSTSL